MAADQLTSDLNHRVASRVGDLVRDAANLRLHVGLGAAGETIIDTGATMPGSLEAGRRVAEIAMGGLGQVWLAPSGRMPGGWEVCVSSAQPVMACLGSQLAGWKLQSTDGLFEALGSGPARALAAREPIIVELGLAERAGTAVLVVEASQPLPAEVAAEVAAACRISPAFLTVILAPTTSLAGSVQIAARALETAIGKAHRLKFPTGDILEGLASAPLAPPHPDSKVAMGRTNDSIIYGSQVQLFVTGPSEAARDLARQLPSTNSPAHGRFFADLYAEAGEDFYHLDAELFSPALVSVTAIEHGQTWTAGALEFGRVAASFGSQPA